MIPSSPTTQAAPLLPTVVSPENNGLIKRGRVKNAAALASIHQTLFNEDWESSRQRARVQAMVDGEAPYSHGAERNTGQGGRANINWGQSADVLLEAERPYTTILESLDTFGTAPTKYGDQESRNQWEPILAEEIARMIKLWPSFFPCWEQNVHLFKMEGVSFAFFDDQRNWQWRVRGLSHLKFPRRTRADVELLDVVTCEDVMFPHELYQKVEAEDILPEDERYWDKQACLDAIRSAGPAGLDTSNWEEVQRVWKDNDITFGVTATVVKVVHGWVKELDGTVSHYIGRYDGEGDFLYKCEGKYRSMSSLMTAFTDGVGTNGDFHSIRGTGYKLFSSAAGLNKLMNKLLDRSMLESTAYLSAPSEDAITDRSLIPMGPYVVLNDKLQFAENPPPAIAHNLMPVLGMLQGVFSSKSTPLAPVAGNSLNRTQKTKFQVQTETEQTGTAQSGGFFLFMSSWERLYKEVVRRICSRDYLPSDPGGAEVHSLHLRLVKRGVPLEALYQLDVEAIEVNTGVGKGSIAERRVVLDTLNTLLYDRLDEEGRNRLNNLTAAAYGGHSLANQLVPPVPGLRPPDDVQFAGMENSLMALGQPPNFVINQNHVVHVDKHLERLYELNTQLEELQLDLGPAIDQMEPMWQHCIYDHMPEIPETNPDHSRFKEALQQLGETITNGRKHLDAVAVREQEKAAEAGIAPGGSGFATGEAPLGLLRSSSDANARAAAPDQLVIAETSEKINAQREKNRREEEKHRLDMKAKTQDMAIKDVRTAAEIRKMAADANKARKPARTA